MKNAGEPGLAGWTVDLEDSSGNMLASVLTDSNGNYSFTGVGGGTYLVAEVVQTNWVQTQPLYPTVYTVTIQSGQNVSGLTFGDHASPALNPVAVIDNGQPGYAETGPWTTGVGGFNGTTRIAKTLRLSGGVTSTASWTFNGLPVGSYDVYVTYSGKSNYSTKAPFTIYDGGTKLATTSINESILVTQSQGGFAQGSYGGVGWLEMGSFSISSSTLEVLLSNNTSGNYVDADGILIISHGAAPAPASIKTAAATANVAMGTTNTSAANTVSVPKTPANAVTAAPTSVSIGGVSGPAAVHVVYNQGASTNSPASSSSLIDAALGVLEITSSRKNRS